MKPPRLSVLEKVGFGAGDAAVNVVISAMFLLITKFYTDVMLLDPKDLVMLFIVVRFIDAITDVQRLMASPQRLQPYTTALINELRARGATAMMSAEIGASIDQQLAVPLPSAPTAMDNGILLRQVELRSELRWLVSVLKARQTATDPSIREFAIESNGLMVVEPFDATLDLPIGAPADADGGTGP